MISNIFCMEIIYARYSWIESIYLRVGLYVLIKILLKHSIIMYVHKLILKLIANWLMIATCGIGCHLVVDRFGKE